MTKYDDLDIEEANEYYYSACKKNDIESIKYLLEKYDDINLIQNKGFSQDSAIDILCRYNHKEIIQYLLEVKNKKHIFLANVQANRKKEKPAFSFSLWKIAEYNHLELLKYIISFYKEDVSLKTMQEGLSICLGGASAGGHIPFVDYLLLSPDLPVYPKLSANNYHPFQLACDNGHIELIKYYLFNEKLKHRPKVDTYNNYAVRIAAWKNHFDLVEYLLTSEDLKEHADIHSAGEGVLEAAIRNENIPMIDFLLHSPKLKEHANLHHKNDLPFRSAVKHNKMLSIQYLICDCEIEKSDDIEFSIKKRRDIKKMFEMRVLYNKLTTNLIAKDNTIKKEKI